MLVLRVGDGKWEGGFHSEIYISKRKFVLLNMFIYLSSIDAQTAGLIPTSLVYPESSGSYRVHTKSQWYGIENAEEIKHANSQQFNFIHTFISRSQPVDGQKFMVLFDQYAKVNWDNTLIADGK